MMQTFGKIKIKGDDNKCHGVNGTHIMFKTSRYDADIWYVR